MPETTELLARARALAELLRPHPHRGDLIGAGAVPLTVALLLVNVRLDAAWGTGVLLVLTALACALVLAMGVLAPLEGERPRSYQVVLQLCGLALLFVALLRLAQVLGADRPLDAAGSSFWILAAVTAAAAWLARERRSAICTLVAAIAGTFALLAFVSWAFASAGISTSRWMLLLAALGLLVGALLLRDRHRAESVYLIDAAGFAVLAIGLTFVGSLLFGFAVLQEADGLRAGFGGPGAWWKLVLLAGGLGLVAYAGVDREAGPGYLGALVLLVFVVLVGRPGAGGPSLWFWPLVLLLVGAAMIAAGLRPREPLPPEPGPAEPAPVVPVAPAPRPAEPAEPAAAEPAREPGAAAEPARERGAAAEPARERGAAAEPVRERGAAEPARERGAVEPARERGAVEPAHERGAAAEPARERGAVEPAHERGAVEPPAPAPGSGRSAAQPPAAPGPARGAVESPTSHGAAEPAAPAPFAPPGPPAPAAPAAEPRLPADADERPAPARPGGERPVPDDAAQPPDPPAPAAPADEPPRADDAATEPRAPRPEPEPPARGSLWARADPREQPTKPHRLPPRARDD